jgi:predicted CXXCH cytochrome family protein
MRIMRTWKNKISAAAIIVLLLSSSIASAGTIEGSPHDFRGYQWKRSGEVCNPCHAMHGTKTLPSPLWNHDLPTQTYVTYAQTHIWTLEAKVSSKPDGLSKICLSCHDGIIAPDAYGGHTCGTAILFQTDLIETFPSNNHPISFIYNAALAMKDGKLYDPSTRLSGLKGSKGTINADMLFLNRMECSSCHDVHNKYAVPRTKLLVKDNAGSALCLTCHNK